jgi:hypothetical protein
MKANSKEGSTRFAVQKVVVTVYTLINLRKQTHLLSGNNLDRITESHRDRPTT